MRLRRVEAEFGDDVRLDWRTYLLRPHPDPTRTLEQFRAYTRSWLRPAAEPDTGTFHVWEGGAGPPSHSVPPHLVSKAAATLGPDAFEAIHERLLHAYFAENRDVTDPDTLRAVWREAGLRVGLYFSLCDWHHPDYPPFADADRPYRYGMAPRPTPVGLESDGPGLQVVARPGARALRGGRARRQPAPRRVAAGRRQPAARAGRAPRRDRRLDGGTRGELVIQVPDRVLDPLATVLAIDLD